ncbi:MAG: hypothetical protein ACT6S0_13595 [Roseateles sp.]|uniref:hypothetical protein n=1 Tax=Roseateles sp. TaxID=1971397 RepID=UPI004035AEDC
MIDGSVHYLDGRTDVAQPKEPSASKSAPAKPDSLCDRDSGVGPYASAVLPTVTIEGTRAQQPFFWADTLQQLGYTPPLPSPFVSALPTMTEEERRAKCNPQTNACLAKASNISSFAYGICSAVAAEAGMKRGGVWGGVVITGIAVACVAGIENRRRDAENQCFAKHADCMNGQ